MSSLFRTWNRKLPKSWLPIRNMFTFQVPKRQTNTQPKSWLPIRNMFTFQVPKRQTNTQEKSWLPIRNMFTFQVPKRQTNTQEKSWLPIRNMFTFQVPKRQTNTQEKSWLPIRNMFTFQVPKRQTNTQERPLCLSRYTHWRKYGVKCKFLWRKMKKRQVLVTFDHLLDIGKDMESLEGDHKIFYEQVRWKEFGRLSNEVDAEDVLEQEEEETNRAGRSSSRSGVSTICIWSSLWRKICNFYIIGTPFIPWFPSHLSTQADTNKFFPRNASTRSSECQELNRIV